MIRKVTDLRTGLVHPTRNGQGRFVSRKDAARQIHILDRTQTRATRRILGQSEALFARHMGYYNMPNGALGFHIQGEHNHKVN